MDYQRVEVILSLVFIFRVTDFVVREFRLAWLPTLSEQHCLHPQTHNWHKKSGRHTFSRAGGL